MQGWVVCRCVCPALAPFHPSLANAFCLAQDSEKGKVLQSIASVIQALPPAEGVAPVEALVGPVLQRLAAALGAAAAVSARHC
jgi:hypothetical protein